MPECPSISGLIIELASASARVCVRPKGVRSYVSEWADQKSGGHGWTWHEMGHCFCRPARERKQEQSLVLKPAAGAIPMWI